MCVCAGCGAAHNGGPFAGLDQYAASSAASRVLVDAETDRSSPIYGQTLELDVVDRGHRPGGAGEAWVFSLVTGKKRRSQDCLYVWGSERAFQENVAYDVASCPADV